MQKYNVVITETLQRVVPVEADSLWEAEEMVHDMYKKEDIVLDYTDIAGVVFEVEDEEVF